MKYFGALLLALPIVISINLFSSPSHAISSCNGPCYTQKDCGGLKCIHRQCHDDPDLGTHICPSTTSPGGGCQPSGTLYCRDKSYPKYRCSPPVTSSTQATLTNNNFSKGGDGGGPSECDGSYHNNSEKIVALSTGWYAGGSRCGHGIKIISTKTKRSVIAKVVDECESMNGCDAEHAYQQPCRNNIVDGSNAVWNALGLDIEVGEEDVTWSMA